MNEKDYIPTIKNYNNLPPFKGMVIQQFPFIEEDFDAITNYQLLCKVVEYLKSIYNNNLIEQENITALYNAYTELVNYIDNYFENLDVQDEINKKLDDLVKDGTLTNLIEAYINPLIEEQNRNINNFKNTVNTSINNIDSKVNSLASGSPKAVSSISEMTDTTKNYVLTSDGNWYYYNGTTWTSGGTYQATSIGDGSIDISKLDNNLKNAIFFNSTDNNFVFSNNMQISSQGVGQYNSAGTRIATEPFYYVKAGSTISVDSNNYKFSVYEYSSNSASSFRKYSSYITGNNPYTIETDGYIRIAMGASDDSAIDNSVAEHLIVNLILNTVKSKIEELDSDIDSIDSEITEINKSLVVESRDNNFVFSDHMQLSNQGATQYNSAGTRIATEPFYPVKAGSTISVDSNNYKFSVCEYSSNSVDSFRKYSSFITGNNPYTIETDGYIRIAMGDINNSEIDNSISIHLLVNIIEYTVKDKVIELNEKTENIYLSDFDKNNNFGAFIPSNHIFGLQNNYSLFAYNTQYSDYISAFDSLVNNYSDYITKTDLGVSSDNTNHLYLYHFRPNQVDVTNLNFTLKKYPKIILIGGQHGFEKSSPYGIYYFIKDLLENYQENESLTYIRNNIELLIVPVVNPYGFNNFVYKNANEVNLNRNYDYNWIHIDDPSSEEYSGEAPFDQPETIIIRNLVENNEDALFFIDFHTNGGWAVTSYRGINWIGFANKNDSYYLENMIYAGLQHLKNVQSYFKKEFSLNTTDETDYGYITISTVNSHGMSKDWVTQKTNIMGCTFEGFNGFPGTQESYTPDVKKANSELISNWILTLLNEYYEKD